MKSYFLGVVLLLQLLIGSPAMALPPVEDVPEEILRTAIYTEARSPVTGRPLTAAEYARLQEELQAIRVEPQINPRIRRLITLLRLRQLLRTFFPFLIR
ncbi:hypothetical protein [Leptolyngbya sp. FACHB-261]|uniref:hypothetical protein n=1 Tax=Leptolyngbya sp. FACHB-261 TaxID=2692806 RepID=UPI001686BD3C|nr:hypothetical protein [Leptolyngbya sp. FACHB-261]MBD2099950.1 hypothetical protein [Leptolyngbya sp. FACHB-261]